MIALTVTLVVISAAVVAHVLTDIERGYAWHGRRANHAALAVALPVFIITTALLI